MTTFDELMARINAKKDRNRQSDEAVARLTGQTVAELGADVTAPDLVALSCGCVLGKVLCAEANYLWWVAFQAAEALRLATDEAAEQRAQRAYNHALAAYDAHFEQQQQEAA